MDPEDIEKPQAMKIRKSIQDVMTESLPEKEFNEEKIDLVEVDIEMDNLSWDLIILGF